MTEDTVKNKGQYSVLNRNVIGGGGAGTAAGTAAGSGEV